MPDYKMNIEQFSGLVFFGKSFQKIGVNFSLNVS